MQNKQAFPGAILKKKKKTQLSANKSGQQDTRLIY